MDEKLFVSRGGRVLRRMFPSLFGFIKALRLFFGHDSFLVKTGFLRSCAEGHPCRKDGTPLPWKNYAIIRFLEERLKPSLSMFEYGSGYSTLFFGGLVGSVVSVESDRYWYEKLRPKCPENVNLIYQPFELGNTYSRLVSSGGRKYDIVVIDGHAREECIVNACLALTRQGVILLDDTHRRFPEIDQHLSRAGFMRIEFEGLKLGGITVDRASLFYRKNNCLGI